ncbi:MAG: precorrin-6A reductase [Ruminococcus sp.]|nr:precorrin-6A reductase [Ruminococcus sp.]
MFRAIIFGGTTEGRELAQFCAAHGIDADISVTTDYGAALLPESQYLRVFTGKLDANQIKELLLKNTYDMVIDATHPYAQLATEHIRTACTAAGTAYFRMLRETSSCLSGTIADSMEALVCYLNKSEKRILSTLGSKELPILTTVNHYAERIWMRLLPADGIVDACTKLGFDSRKIIFGKGPFSTAENLLHIRRSGAEILVTKESGSTGGYPEKVRAAAESGIEIVTVQRPYESGYSKAEIQDRILEKVRGSQ